MSEFEEYIKRRMVEIEKEIEERERVDPVIVWLEVPFDELCQIAIGKGLVLRVSSLRESKARVGTVRDPISGTRADFLEDWVDGRPTTGVVKVQMGRFKRVFIGEEGAVG